MRFCYKTKNKERENTKNTKDEDEFAFAKQYETHSMSVCKRIMDLEATKYITLYRVAFDTYEVISLGNVRLGDNSIAKAIRMVSIIVGVQMGGNIYRIRIADVPRMLKLQTNLLLVNTLMSNGLKV